MLLLTTTEFRNNMSKYLSMAFTQKIALKSKGGIIELNPSETIRTNPSPSGDTYFDNPKNLEAIDEGLKDYKEGRYKTYTDLNELKKDMGLLNED